MPARDPTHEIVKYALEKEGWIITHDPYYIKIGGVEFFIDLGAATVIAAQRNEKKIAVEIKSFLGASSVSEFHNALGQFLNYRLALEEIEPERVLYLSVPQSVYEEFFSLEFIKKVIEKYELRLIIFQENEEVITQWIN